MSKKLKGKKMKKENVGKITIKKKNNNQIKNEKKKRKQIYIYNYFISRHIFFMFDFFLLFIYFDKINK